LKLKYSNPLAHRFLDKIEKSKLRSNVMLELVNFKKIQILTCYLQKEQGLATLERKSFFVSLEKLYNKPRSDHLPTSSRTKNDKLQNILILTTEKIFTTQRDPITPYSSERVPKEF